MIVIITSTIIIITEDKLSLAKMIDIVVIPRPAHHYIYFNIKTINKIGITSSHSTKVRRKL